MSPNERSAHEPELSIIHDKQSQTIAISSQHDGGRGRTWSSGGAFEHFFSGDYTNDQVYEETVKPVLAQVMDGATCNFFAYGHSGSGKTHTIIGYDHNDNRQLGLCLSAGRDLFRAIEDEIQKTGAAGKYPEERLGVAVRVYEIRGKSAFDLLNHSSECYIRQGPDGRTHIRGKTEMLDDGKVMVRPIVAKPVGSYEELRQVVEDGLRLRKVGSSSVHNESSRTHAFIELEVINAALLKAREEVIARECELVPVGKRATDVYLEEHSKSLIRTDDGKYLPNPECPLNQNRIDEAEAKKSQFELRLELAERTVRECFDKSHHPCLGGMFVFVDLAGSEYLDQASGKCAEKLRQTPQEQRQGRQINTDLFALKEVIRARNSGRARIPFRSSPLTMVLRSHFEACGNGSSSIILTVSPLSTQFAATKNTLSYGSLIGVI